MHIDARRRLEVLLDVELGVARELTQTLDAERIALTGTDPQAVEAEAAAKLEVLARLEQLEKSRLELCREAGISLPPAPTVASSPTGAADSIVARWQTLMDMMARCRAANEVNGYIVNVRRNQVQQLLDVVRGTKSHTYGPGGKTTVRALRDIARA